MKYTAIAALWPYVKKRVLDLHRLPLGEFFLLILSLCVCRLFSSYDIIYITNILLIAHLLDLCTRRMFPPEDLQLYLNITTTTISNPAEFLLRWYLADSRGNMPWTTETQRRVWSACLLLTTLLCSSLMNASSGAFIVPICMLCMYICTQNELVE